jgi:predicted nucleotidyltransferase
MRITRDTLLKIARDTAAERLRVSRRIVCVYLSGSCLAEDPLIGGAGDIDLVIIEDGQPLLTREVVRLNDDVSLDISHFAQDDFQQPRRLRVEPWLGPILYNKPLVLHDSNHWFDYIQASTGASFLQPDNVLARARRMAELARQDWTALSFSPSPDPARRVYAYLRALEHAGNAIASLNGIPLPERRFLLDLPKRAAALQLPSFSADLLHMVAAEVEITDDGWKEWLQHWDSALRAASEMDPRPARLHPARRRYYTQAAAALWTEHPNAAFWILARTFALAAAHLPPDSPHRAAFQQICDASGLSALTDMTLLDPRLESLDHFLDGVEETLDRWAQKNGVSPA